MAQVTNELMYEVLKQIPVRLDKIEAGIGGIRHGIVSLRLSQTGIRNDIHTSYGILGRHDECPDRIQRRLDLRELAESAHARYEPNS